MYDRYKSAYFSDLARPWLDTTTLLGNAIKAWYVQVSKSLSAVNLRQPKTCQDCSNFGT